MVINRLVNGVDILCKDNCGILTSESFPLFLNNCDLPLILGSVAIFKLLEYLLFQTKCRTARRFQQDAVKRKNTLIGQSKARLINRDNLVSLWISVYSTTLAIIWDLGVL